MLPPLSSDNKADLITRWKAIKQRIQTITYRPNSEPPSEKIQKHITLLAVSKTQPAEMIATLAQQGQRDFGENYLQEAMTKIEQLKYVMANDKPLIWHYIGHIQRNKTRDLSQNFDWVHGVDRLMIAQRLNDQRPDHLPPLNICIQVNIDDEASKSGCQPNELAELVQKISQLPHLCLRGLMIIPAKHSRTAFIKTKQLFENHRQYHAHPSVWDTLSMGMSGDMNEAIEAGATMVRIGTAIFGERDYTTLTAKSH